MTDFTGDPFGAAAPSNLPNPATPTPAPAGTLPEAPLSYTFRVGQSLFTLRASNAQGFKEIAQDVIGADLVAVAATLNKVASSHTETAPPSPAYAPAQQAAAPAAPQQRATSSQSCAHGPLVFDTWQAKGGNKTYKAFKCPLKVQNWRDPNACDMLVWAN